MNKTRRTQKFFITITLLSALLLAACGSNDSDLTSIPTTIPLDDIPQGGELVIGAAQNPECLDFIHVCSGDVWGLWTVAVQTLPRPYAAERVYDGSDPTDDWEVVPTELLEGEAEVSDDLLTITYNINEDAVWDDGTKITADDFIYTWTQIVEGGDDIYDPTGYTSIENITSENEGKTAVVSMSEPYVPWKNLFGTTYGLLPAHILEGQDRNAVMKDGFEFSGGPFKLESWTKGESIVLVKNENYWGDQANLDKVTFEFREDTTAQFTAFRNNEISVIYSDVQPDVVEGVNSGLDDANVYANKNTANVESLLLNNGSAPFDSTAVRQALGYSMDRDSIVGALFGDLDINEAANSFVPPILSDYSQTDAFSDYTTNSSKARDLLEEDGWARNDAGVYEKDGEELEFEIITTEGDDRRRLLMENIQSQLQDNGWKVNIRTLAFGDALDAFFEGEYQALIFAAVGTGFVPDLCFVFCDGPLNIADERVTELAGAISTELNDEARFKAAKDAEKYIAENAFSYPLSNQPSLMVWKENVVGQVDDNPFQGPFWNLNNWGVRN